MSDFSIDDFLETVKTANTDSRAQYRRVLVSCEGWAGKPLSSLALSDLAELMKRLRGMLSGQHYATILRMFFDRAEMEQHRKRAVLKQRLKVLGPDDILTVAEVQAMIDATDTTRDRALIAALYETGVRVSELLNLNLEHVSRKEQNGGPEGYVLWFGKVKIASEAHRGFIYESTPVFQSWLNAHPDRNNPASPLFCNFGRGGKRMSRKGAWNVVYRAAKRAGIEKHVHPHTFRHSRTTHLLQRGATEAEVAKLHGWKAGSPMLARYSHLTDEDAERAVLKAGGFNIPEPTEIGRLSFPDEKLRPIVPVASPPGVTFPTIEEIERFTANLSPEQINAIAEMVWPQILPQLMAKIDAAAKAAGLETAH